MSQYEFTNANDPKKANNDFMFSVLVRVGAEFEADRYLGNHSDIFDNSVLEFNGIQSQFTTDTVEKWLETSDDDYDEPSWSFKNLDIAFKPQGSGSTAKPKKLQVQA